MSGMTGYNRRLGQSQSDAGARTLVYSLTILRRYILESRFYIFEILSVKCFLFSVGPLYDDPNSRDSDVSSSSY